MSKALPDMLPITPATVEINGSRWPAKSTIWTGLRVHQGKAYDASIWSNDDHYLLVPWCHADDVSDGKDDAHYRLRPLDERYRFKKARNGSWVLVSAPASAKSVQPLMVLPKPAAVSTP